MKHLDLLELLWHNPRMKRKSIRSIWLIWLLFTCLLSSTCYGDCEVYGLVLNKGEAKTVPGQCSQVICRGNRYDEYEIQSCPDVYAGRECTFIGTDLTKSYPKCCPHWKCPEINN